LIKNSYSAPSVVRRAHHVLSSPSRDAPPRCNLRIQLHHRGTKDTKVFVGCASRTGQSRNISRKACPEPFGYAQDKLRRRDAKAAKVTGQGPSSRANARDLRKISPLGRNDIDSELGVLCALARVNPPDAISETCFTQKREDPQFQDTGSALKRL